MQRKDRNQVNAITPPLHLEDHQIGSLFRGVWARTMDKIEFTFPYKLHHSKRHQPKNGKQSETALKLCIIFCNCRLSFTADRRWQKFISNKSERIAALDSRHDNSILLQVENISVAGTGFSECNWDVKSDYLLFES